MIPPIWILFYAATDSFNFFLFSALRFPYILAENDAINDSMSSTNSSSAHNHVRQPLSEAIYGSMS